MVWAGANAAIACLLNYADSTPSGGVSGSTGSDPGATWQSLPSRYMFYRLYGTYTTEGTPVDVTRSELTGVKVALQTDDAAHSRIESAIPLDNEPEPVSAVWRADFEPGQPDPTAIDLDGDGNLDWAMESGSFNVKIGSAGNLDGQRDAPISTAQQL